ncbi:CDGP domain-containing protein [Mycobacterium parmense]
MNTNCESAFNGTMWCDGPIRPDGTWARCFAVSGTQRCFMYDPANPPTLPLGQPNHHIGL